MQPSSLRQGCGNSEVTEIGRWSWPAAGLPIKVPGYQLDRRCGSGLQAVINAVAIVQTGTSDVVLSRCRGQPNVEHYTAKLRPCVKSGSLELYDGLTRGRLRRSRSNNSV
jgi:acetyl-CoA C-acetyltransferase